MRKRLKNKIIAFFAAGTILTSAAPQALAARADSPQANGISISTAEELMDFADKCSLDSWSKGKTVTLTADLDLSGKGFAPIPIFSGTFDGGGHTISGLRIVGVGSNQGLFRYLEPGASVKDLNVSGVVMPGGSQSSVGGIAGVNAGTIRGCSFLGTVKGDTNVGGIAGKNDTGGEIINCTVSGYTCGKTSTGGIAGRNQGLLLKCTNNSGVNLTEFDSSSDILNLDADQLLDYNEEDDESYNLRNSCSDTGGIAGYSNGVVQSCTNTGSVGYPHVGYNAGGIAGRQSGYLASCVNSGTINGRKEVGGIVGQAEPYLFFNPGEDTINQLRTELDTLNALINDTLNDTQSTGDDISEHLNAMKEYTDTARNSSREISDSVSDFVDDNVNTVNTLSADITEALEDIAPALDDFSDIGDKFSQMSDSLGGALNAFGDAVSMGDAAMTSVRGAVDDLEGCSENLKNASEDLKSALEAIQDGILSGDDDTLNNALDSLQSSAEAMSGVFGDISDAVEIIRDALANEDIPEIPEEDMTKLKNDMDSLADSLDDMSKAIEDINDKLPEWQDSFDSAGEDLKNSADDLNKAAENLNDSFSALKTALDDLEPMSDAINEAIVQLQNAASDASSIGQLTQSAFRTISDAVRRLTGKGAPEFKPLGEDFHGSSDDLFDAMSGISDEMDSLNSLVQDGGDKLTDNLKAVNDQIKTVYDVILDAFGDLRDDTENIDLDNYFQDTSDEDLANTREGKVTSCRNTGTVEGDRNIGGVAGAMAIEFDKDPEDDIADNISVKARYETKAVLQQCVNYGSVSAKKECAGGLVGRMDLGTALHCENYGAVASSGGNYVGGIAGLADATVRNCFAKSTLSGGNYIGGIAGSASRLRDCYAIATITEGVEYLGAISGNVKTNGVLSGNRFVNTGLAGVDGISYADRAAPIEFEELQKLPDVPEDFMSFTLTLKANDKLVQQIPFRYGDDLSKIELPEVPVLEGNYGVWPSFDTSGVNSDITLEAVYAPWITMLPSAETTDYDLPLALAEGQFTSDMYLHVLNSTEAPPIISGNNARVLEISLTETELDETSVVPIRLLNYGSKNAKVWRLSEGQWQAVDAVQSGQYLLLTMTGTSDTFCIQPEDMSFLPFVIIGAAAAVIILLIIVLIKKHKKNKAAKTEDSEKNQTVKNQ